MAFPETESKQFRREARTWKKDLSPLKLPSSQNQIVGWNNISDKRSDTHTNFETYHFSFKRMAAENFYKLSPVSCHSAYLITC